LRVFRTKEFTRFAKRQRIGDRALCDAVARAGRGIIDADLGGGLIKQRVARPGQGRSGGFRTLIVYRAAARSVFVYGFAKSERANIDPDELMFWRKVAAAFMTMAEAAIAASILTGEITEMVCDDKTKSS
jgi:hypothetical protein